MGIYVVRFLAVAERNSNAKHRRVRRGFREMAVSHEFRRRNPIVIRREKDLLFPDWAKGKPESERAYRGPRRFTQVRNSKDYPADGPEGPFMDSYSKERRLPVLHPISAERTSLLCDSRPVILGLFMPTGARIRISKDLA
jgi:hypothetical protein